METVSFLEIKERNSIFYCGGGMERAVIFLLGKSDTTQSTIQSNPMILE
jgi:hypothetical protein